MERDTHAALAQAGMGTGTHMQSMTAQFTFP